MVIDPAICEIEEGSIDRIRPSTFHSLSLSHFIVYRIGSDRLCVCFLAAKQICESKQHFIAIFSSSLLSIRIDIHMDDGKEFFFINTLDLDLFPSPSQILSSLTCWL